VIKLLPYILFEKYIYVLALEMANPGNRQLCRHTFVPYKWFPESTRVNIGWVQLGPRS